MTSDSATIPSTVTDAMREAGEKVLWALADSEGDGPAFKRAASDIYLAMLAASRSTEAPASDDVVGKLWRRRHELSNAEWLEAAPVLLGRCVALKSAAPPVEVGELEPRTKRLVLAARAVAFGGYFDVGCEHKQDQIRELDQASEAFAADVPWDI
jgi:hypothetical protein